MFDDFGFATLAQAKARLGISDTADDAILTALLVETASDIERVAGRRLRRDHARTECFTGGGPVLRTMVAPILVIHSIRESETRDFDTPGNYEELIEGTDYVLLPGVTPDGRRLPGATGEIRRLHGTWMGTEPGQVRVQFTGGYKTDDEAALEGALVTISAASDIDDFAVTEDGDFLDEAEAQIDSDNQEIVMSFRTAGAVAPIWQVSALTLTVQLRAELGLAWLRWLSVDPRTATAAQLYTAVTAAADLAEFVVVDVQFNAFTFSTMSDELRALLAATLLAGHVSFGITSAPYGGAAVTMASVQHETANLRPTLAIRHRRMLDDPYGVPADLRSANITQACYEYQTRKSAGMISQAMRGVASSSGASYLKTQMDLLPAVRRAAMRYRRLY